MTSLFSLTEGEVLKRELRQLEPVRLSRQQATCARAQIGRRCKWVFILPISKLRARDPSVPELRRG
jgi:hypothetical protein